MNLVAILVLLLVTMGAVGGYIIYERTDAVNDYKAKLDVADRALKEQADVLMREQANHITDMEAAYETGEAEAKVVTQKIYVKGQAYVANDKGLSNPVCVMDDGSLQFLRSALASLRSPTDPGEVVGAVPGAGVTGSTIVQRPVPELPKESGAVGAVHAPASAVSAGSAVSGTGAAKVHPKPVPTK